MNANQHETPDYDSFERPDLPNGWQWASGEVAPGNYTLRFETEYAQGGDLVVLDGIGGYYGEVYWDKGGRHNVVLYPIVGIREDGDAEISEYGTMQGQYDTMQEAADAVPEKIRELKEQAAEKRNE